MINEVKKKIDDYMNRNSAEISRLKKLESDHVDDLERKEKEVSAILDAADSMTKAQGEKLTKLSAEIQTEKTILETLNQKILKLQNRPADPEGAKVLYEEIQASYDAEEKKIQEKATKLFRDLVKLYDEASVNYSGHTALIDTVKVRIEKPVLPAIGRRLNVSGDSILHTLGTIRSNDSVKRLLDIPAERSGVFLG